MRLLYNCCAWQVVLLLAIFVTYQCAATTNLDEQQQSQVVILSRDKRFLDKVMDSIGIKDVIKLGGDLISGILSPIFGNKAQKEANKAAERRHQESMAFQRSQFCLSHCVSEWSAWSICTQPCGGGSTTRTRTLSIPSNCGEGFSCPHTLKQEAPCNPRCPHGGSPKSNGGCNCPPGRAGICCESEVRCEYPGRPRNGDISGSSPYVYGSVVTFDCHDGYTLGGSHEIICGPNGAWNGDAPTCSDITCQVPNIPTNGALLNRKDSYYFEEEVMYTCTEGYGLQGPEVRRCIERGGRGIWTGFQPICREGSCGQPHLPLHGEVHGTNFRLGAEVTITCSTGFRLLGSSVRTCQASGRWSGHDTQCDPITCETPFNVRNGYHYPERERHVFGNTVQFECQPGFVLEGETTLKCVADPDAIAVGPGGKWNGQFPTCKAVLCPDLPDLENGAKDGQIFHYPHNVTFTCFAGYVLKGADKIHCSRNGAWTAVAPTCEACPLGWYKANTFTDTMCEQCPENTDTLTVGSSSRAQCLCNQGYTGPAGGPCEEIRCPVLTTPDKGSMSQCDNRHGSVCLFDCQDGYILSSGSGKRTCLEDRTWSGADAVCQACPIDTYKSNERSCVPCPTNSHTNQEAQSKTGCVCDAGYTGPAGGPCNDINECAANGGRGPCQDICINLIGDYRCDCSIPGYVIDPMNKHACIVDQTCRNLTTNDAPENGGLVCHWYHQQNSQQCSVRCNAGYEFPSRVNNFEYCGDTTGYVWSHEERGESFDPCVEELFPDFRLEADSFYFVRACNELTAEEQDEVRQAFAETLNKEGICKKRATKVCDIRNIGIICGRSVRRKKRDLSGEEETVENVQFQMNVTALKYGDGVTDCESRICPLLRIRPQICTKRLCESVYKRFLKAAVLYSKRQLENLYSNPQNARFNASNRDFEPEEKDKNLRISELKTECGEGMAANGTLCVPCTAGTHLKNGQCVPCPVGYFQPFEKQLACLPCPAGTTSMRKGSTICTACPAGRYGLQCNSTCPPCIHGRCDPRDGHCECSSGWEGPSCDTDIESCSPDTCHPGVVCEDIPAPGTGFRCGACPEGTTGDGVLCVSMEQLAALREQLQRNSTNIETQTI